MCAVSHAGTESDTTKPPFTKTKKAVYEGPPHENSSLAGDAICMVIALRKKKATKYHPITLLRNLLKGVSIGTLNGNENGAGDQIHLILTSL